MHKRLKDSIDTDRNKDTEDDTLVTAVKRTEKEEIELELIHMLTRNNLPFSIVEDPFLKKLMEKAYKSQSFKLKGRQHYATVVLPRAAEDIIENLYKKVSGQPYAITTDGWADKTKPSTVFYRSVWCFGVIKARAPAWPVIT